VQQTELREPGGGRDIYDDQRISAQRKTVDDLRRATLNSFDRINSP
jgi:hypothetical protein